MVMQSDRVELLKLLRDELKGAIQDARTPNVTGATQPSAVAALSKELRAVQAELESLGAKAEVSVADELAARAAARMSGAADSAPPTKRGQSRRSNGVHRTG